MGFQEILLIGVPVLTILIAKLLADWLFEIKKRNRYMEAQIRLLMHIASKQGVDADRLSDIVAEARMPLVRMGK